jgi:hypothetical protein
MELGMGFWSAFFIRLDWARSWKHLLLGLGFCVCFSLLRAIIYRSRRVGVHGLVMVRLDMVKAKLPGVVELACGQEDCIRLGRPSSACEESI